MVKKRGTLLFFLVAVLFCISGGCNTKSSMPEKQNLAPDVPNLEAAISVTENQPEPAAPFKTIKLPNGTIKYYEVDDLSRIPEDIDTKALAFANGTFTDLSPLLEYRDIETLEIWYNHSLRDISPLVSLPALRKLVIVECNYLQENIQSIQPLSFLTGLTSLFLTCNDLTLKDIRPLANLTELRVGSYGPYGAPVDLTSIAGLTALESLYLLYSRGPYQNWHLLSNLVNLKTLSIAVSIYGSKEVDLGWMRDLANLEFFRLQGGRVADVRPLAALPRLKSIGFPDCAVPDILPLSRSGSLEAVYYGSDTYPEAVYEAFRAQGIILSPYYDR